jgi:hypothetical protein
MPDATTPDELRRLTAFALFRFANELEAFADIREFDPPTRDVGIAQRRQAKALQELAAEIEIVRASSRRDHVTAPHPPNTLERKRLFMTLPMRWRQLILADQVDSHLSGEGEG